MIKNLLLRQLSYYVLFNLVSLISITIIVSLITFFHFLLDHPIEAIESWIFYNGWELIITSKIVSLILIIKFYILNINEKFNFKSMFLDHIRRPGQEFIPILLFFLCLFFIFDKPQLNGVSDISNLKIIKSFFYSLIFYILDLFFLAQISSDSQLSRGEQNIKNFLFPLVFIITSKLSFLLITVTDERGQITGLVTFLNMVMLLYFARLNREKIFSFIAPLIFLFLYICPLIALFGLDPVLGDSMSVYNLGIITYSKNYVILSLLILCYLYLKNKSTKDSYGVN